MTALCVEKGLDVNDKNARQRVVWVAEEGNRNDGVLPLTSGQEAEVEGTPEQDDDIYDVDSAGATNLQRTIRGRYDAIVTEAIEEVVFEEMLAPTTNPKVHCDPIEFVRFFSRVNFSSSQTLVGFGKKAQRRLPVYTGNSRDPVTLFLTRCTNASLGCEYQMKNRTLLAVHEKKCPLGTRAE